MTDQTGRDGGVTVEEPWGYRPYLDGLRALAVLLVVGFHAGADRLTGGFIGVDVFFVLSGYLVTQLLLKDVRGQGAIGYGRFYARRFRRLLPAAGVVLITTAIVYPGIGSQSDFPAAEDAIRAAALYVSNWYFIGEASDYFAGDVQANPVLHFWSLSVEEQFYLAWPLLLGGVLAVARRFKDRMWMAVRLIVIIGLLASVAQALRLQGDDLNRAYYGTDARAYQLLAGALLALTPAALHALRRSPRLAPLLRLCALASVAGLVVLATSVLEVSAITRGILTTVLTIGLVTCLEGTTGGAARFALSLPPVVYLGRISYGIYLWHWLVILVTVERFDLAPPAVAAVAAVVASGLAALSYQLLEMPVRESRALDRRRLSVVAAGLVTSVLLGFVVAPEILNRDVSTAPVVVAGGTEVRGGGKIPDDLDWRGAAEDHGAFPVCAARAPRKCTLVEGPPGALHILLMGDSHARMYIPALTRLAEDRSLTLSVTVAPGCPWQRGILRSGEGLIGTEVQDLGPQCRAHHDEWYDTIIPALNPDVIVGVNQPWDDPQSERQIEDEVAGPVEPGSGQFFDVVTRRTQETLDSFQADGRQVIMVEPVSVASDGQNPLSCLSEATFFDECEFETGTTPTPIEGIYRGIATAQEDDVFVMDLDLSVCPGLPICEPVVDGLIVRWDAGHLTQRFATTLAPRFEAFLKEVGVLP